MIDSRIFLTKTIALKDPVSTGPLTRPRDPRNKTGPSTVMVRSKKKFAIWDRTGPGPRKFQNLGPDRTRINKILKISDRFGPVGPQTRRSVDPWPDHWKTLISDPRSNNFKNSSWAALTVSFYQAVFQHHTWIGSFSYPDLLHRQPPCLCFGLVRVSLFTSVRLINFKTNNLHFLQYLNCFSNKTLQY